MQDKLRALYARYGDILRYLIVGGLTTLLDNVIFGLLHDLWGMHFALANVFAWFFAVAFAFVGNKWVVFRTQTGKRALLGEAASFVAMRLITLLFSEGFLALTIGLWAWDSMLSKAISSVVVIVLNYLLSRLFVFKKHGQ